MLVGGAAWIGLQERWTRQRRADLVLVACTCGHSRKEDLPDALRVPLPHRVHAAVPVVEVANHADTLGVGGPHGEAGAGDTVDAHRVRSKASVQLEVPALAEQVQVEFPEQQREGVGVGRLRHSAGITARHTQAIGKRFGDTVEDRLEQSVGVQFTHRRDARCDARVRDDRHAGRAGLEGANRESPATGVGRDVGAEHRERVTGRGVQHCTQSEVEP